MSNTETSPSQFAGVDPATTVAANFSYSAPGLAKFDSLFVTTLAVAEAARELLGTGKLATAPIDIPPLAQLPLDRLSVEGKYAQLAKTAPRVLHFIDVLHQLDVELQVAEQNLAGQAPIPGQSAMPSLRLSVIRGHGTSPKQLALLLNCQAVFRNDELDPAILFSRTRFAQANGYHFLAEGDA